MGTLAGSWHLRLAAKYRGGSPGSIPTLSHQPSGDGCGAVGLVWAGGCGRAGPGGGGGGDARFGRTGVGRGLQVWVWAGLVAAGPWVPVWVAHGPSAARCPMVPTSTPSATQPLSAAPWHSPARTDAASLRHAPSCTHTRTHTCTPMHTACPPPRHTGSKLPADAGPTVAVAQARPCRGAAGEAFVCRAPPHVPRPRAPARQCPVTPQPPNLSLPPCVRSQESLLPFALCLQTGGGQQRGRGARNGHVVSLAAGSHHPVPNSWL